MSLTEYSFDFSAISDKGRFREKNEDCCLSILELGLFFLADGMGGHRAGEVASKEAVEFLADSLQEFIYTYYDQWSVEDLSEFLRVLVENTNSWVHGLAQKKAELRGMGTTLCALFFYKNSLILANVGDSRIYLLRNQKLRQLSVDHSLENALIASGNEEQSLQASKNILTMAIGTSIEVIPQIDIVAVEPGDVYLMCSDGLSDYVEEKDIEKILNQSSSLKEKAQKLIQTAISRKSTDNITVQIVYVRRD